MGVFDKLFGRQKKDTTQEHAIIVYFDYGLPDLQPLFALEGRLEAALASAVAGEYDGNEIAVDRSDGTLWMYGPDADAMFVVVHPILLAEPFMAGARVKLRYGPPQDGVPERNVLVGSE